jgi:hypothetical protein
VAVPGVFAAGISEADDDLHRVAPPLGSSAPERRGRSGRRRV